MYLFLFLNSCVIFLTRSPSLCDILNKNKNCFPCFRRQESSYKNVGSVFGHGGGPALRVPHPEEALQPPQPAGSIRGLPQEG